MTDDSDRSSSRPALTEIASGFRKRTLKTARLAGKVGMGMLKKTMRPDEPVSEPMDEDVAIQAASDMLETLDGLKGLVMKFGQMASYLNPNLPPKAQRVLAKLQSESQPMAYPQIADVVEEELGDRPEALYDRFEEVPFAAASIGQVHRAVWKGREVAVKVQYPGVDEVLDSDIKNLGRMMRLISMGSELDGKGLTAELRERIGEECNYTQEADNQTRLRAIIELDPRASVPRVIEERSARRVLTTTMASGMRFYDFLEKAEQEQKNAAAQTIFDVSMRCLFRHCAYNADPHPGNYLFADNGDITFLDFGCMKWFTPAFMENWRTISYAVLEDDRATFKNAYIEAGFCPKPDKMDWDFQWDVMEYLYHPMKLDEPFRYTHEFVSRSYNLIVFKNPNRLVQALPPDWLFINRLQWGLNSMFAHLDATLPWGELFGQFWSRHWSRWRGTEDAASVARVGRGTAG